MKIDLWFRISVVLTAFLLIGSMFLTWLFGIGFIFIGILALFLEFSIWYILSYFVDWEW